jgi:hypothetical protein
MATYSLIGYDYAYDIVMSYGVFSSMENVKKAIEELVLNHINKIAESEDFIHDKSVLDDHLLNEEEQIFRKTLHIIMNGEMDKLTQPTIRW